MMSVQRKLHVMLQKGVRCMEVLSFHTVFSHETICLLFRGVRCIEMYINGGSVVN